MFKIGDRAGFKIYFLGKNRFASGEIVKIAKHPTMYKIMYKIDLDNLIVPIPNWYEWMFEKELLHIVTICS